MAVAGRSGNNQILFTNTQRDFAVGKSHLRQDNLNLSQGWVLPFCSLQRWNASLFEQFPTARVRNYCSTWEETTTPRMIGVIMCIDHITHRYIQFVFNEFEDTQG